MDGTSAQFRHVNREVRQFVRIAPSIVVVQGGRAFVGQDVSIGGFCVQADEDGEVPADGQSEVRFILNGFQVAIVVSARMIWQNADGNLAGYMMTFLEAGQRETLRRLIRSHLSGQRLEVEQAITNEDGQTPPSRGAGDVNTTDGRSWRSIAGYTVSAIAVTILLVAVVSSVYGRVKTNNAEFATITAPAIAMRAPAAGLVAAHQISPGQFVNRDEPLMRIGNSELESRIALSEAALDFNTRLAGNIEEQLNHSGSNSDTMISTLDPDSIDLESAANFDQLNRAEARERLDVFQLSRDYEQSRIAALRLRLAANAITAPCDCLVRWVLPGGSWVDEGDELLRLADAQSSNLLVEAVVPISATAHIAPQQQARIYLQNQTSPISGRVVGVDFDRVGTPRMGFPDWVSHDQSLARVTIVSDAALSTADIGRPADVIILRNGGISNVLGSAANTVARFLREQAQRITGIFVGAQIRTSIAVRHNSSAS